FDEGDLVDDLGGVRYEFAGPGAVLAMLAEFVFGGSDGEAGLAAGHGGEALAFADGFGEVFVEHVPHFGFVVPHVHLRGAFVHKEVDSPLGLRREVRQAGDATLSLYLVTGLNVGGKHAGEGDGTQAERALGEKLTAGEEVEGFVVGGHLFESYVPLLLVPIELHGE